MRIPFLWHMMAHHHSVTSIQCHAPCRPCVGSWAMLIASVSHPVQTIPAGTGGSYQLGTGNTEDQAVPTLINDGGSQIYRSVACGDSHTCALRADGQIVCFGNNIFGRCGDGTAKNYVMTPATVAGGIAFKRIAAGEYHTCGLRASDGRAMCFGECRLRLLLTDVDREG